MTSSSPVHDVIIVGSGPHGADPHHEVSDRVVETGDVVVIGDAVGDVVRYLVGVLDAPEAAGRVFEVGGPEVLTYLQMLTRVADLQNRHLFVVPVPLLSPQLSSRWLSLVTDVDVATGRSLIDSMTNEVVVTDDAIRRIVPFEPVGYDQMVMTALLERARERRERAGEKRGGWLSRGARR